MYAVERTTRFNRKHERFLRLHPELKNRLTAILTALVEDPFTPSLRTYALRGAQEGFYSVSVTRSFRLVLQIDNAETTIILYDIGSHDEVYG